MLSYSTSLLYKLRVCLDLIFAFFVISNDTKNGRWLSLYGSNQGRKKDIYSVIYTGGTLRKPTV